MANLVEKTVIMDEQAIRRAIIRIAHEIIENNKGDQFTAKVVYVNKQNDLAILKVTDSKNAR